MKYLKAKEPCCDLDPAIASFVGELNEKYAVVILAHNLNKAVRFSDSTVLMYVDGLVKFNKTQTLFEMSESGLTKNYVEGIG